jgi:hypothetical protein
MTGLDRHDRTLVGIGAGPAMASLGEFANALAPATRLHEFEILSVIGQGGFGIVYLAQDLTLDRKVAIKEYMPSSLATRTQGLTVAVHSDRQAETFAAGLRSFLNEARLLARFDHSSLLKVHRFWEAHGTAYMVMPYYEGVTLGKMLAKLGRRPDEATLKALLHPLLDALELMHSANCYHRDIAPDNILILPDGRPMLLDFGAARRVIGDMTQALTVILKTGYAPVEQYGDIPDMAQGAWTDLYALGSVVHFAITGRTPPQALTRFMDDRREPLAMVAAGRYSDEFLHAIDRALAVLPKNRPQSVAELRALMGAGASAPWGRTEDSVPRPGPMEPAPMPTAALEPTRRIAPPERTADTTQGVWPASIEPATLATLALAPPAPPAAVPTGRRAIVAASGTVLLVLAASAAGFAWFGSRPREPAAPLMTTAPALPADVSAIGAADPAPISAPVPSVAIPSAKATAPLTETALPAEHAAPVKQKAAADSAELPPPVAETPRSAKTTARAHPAPEHRPAPPATAKNTSSDRCADIIHRVSIGEEPSDAEKALLKQECRK